MVYLFKESALSFIDLFCCLFSLYFCSDLYYFLPYTDFGQCSYFFVPLSVMLGCLRFFSFLELGLYCFELLS